MCETDVLQPNGSAIELINWKNKFSASIMDLCNIEIVQIEDFQASSSAEV